MSPKRRICILQHAPFEGPAAIKKWIVDREYSLSITKLYQGESLPLQNKFDWLIVMGGSMGVGDNKQYPWLIQKKCDA